MNLTDLTPIDANLGRRDLVGGSPIDDVPDQGRCFVGKPRASEHTSEHTGLGGCDRGPISLSRLLLAGPLSRTDEGSDEGAARISD